MPKVTGTPERYAATFVKRWWERETAFGRKKISKPLQVAVTPDGVRMVLETIQFGLQRGR